MSVGMPFSDQVEDIQRQLRPIIHASPPPAVKVEAASAADELSHLPEHQRRALAEVDRDFQITLRQLAIGVVVIVVVVCLCIVRGH